MEIVPIMPEVDFGRDPIEDLHERLSWLRSQGHRVVPMRLHLARAELRVSLSLLLDRLPGLRLADSAGAKVTGAILRGVHRRDVKFDDVLPAIDYREPTRMRAMPGVDSALPFGPVGPVTRRE
jgi:hypothetical protein